ncbi:hypothetical protein D0B54_06170 [Solimonas sp. K1W22B-7]|uniref:hypothetical protein n=1 Tax=Solimonas sp. K1W22B-7 TaxID=2303331 RepID=UPI000E32E522|nr:hypothetical protein [Solimonas sp. K1W22B-7]AXQ28291.1 hypothetical protein D0B54_06170 [Solimonas sp. K1W22B-7]
MICEHLAELERVLQAARIEETYRGQPWSKNCREWVYYRCVLDLAAIRTRHALADCVKDHVHRGTHDGSEQGLVCEVHHDALVGAHPDSAGGAPRFAG